MSPGPIRRQVMEVATLMPNARGEDFLLQPLFVRDSFGGPLRWQETHLPESTTRRFDAVLARYSTTTADLLSGGTAGVLDPAPVPVAASGNGHGAPR